MSKKTAFSNAAAARGVIFLAAMLAPVFHVAAKPPEKGSDQMRYLQEYSGFIQSAHTTEGNHWCCDLSDGRAHMVEIDNGDGSFDVIATREAYPTLPEKEMKIHVPPERVIAAEAIQKAIDDCKADTSGKWDKKTCKAPSFNILWIAPSSGMLYCYYKTPKPG